jgi:hypothetical protein
MRLVAACTLAVLSAATFSASAAARAGAATPPWQVIWHGTWDGSGPDIDPHQLPQKQFLDQSTWTFAVFGRAATATRFAREQLKNLAGFAQPNLVQVVSKVDFTKNLLGVIIEKQAGCGDLHVSTIAAPPGAVVASVYREAPLPGAACAQAVGAVIKLVTIDRHLLPAPPRAAGLVVGPAPS